MSKRSNAERSPVGLVLIVLTYFIYGGKIFLPLVAHKRPMCISHFSEIIEI